MLYAALTIACLLLVGSFAWILAIACKPSPGRRQLLEDLEVMRLEAMWDVPWEERS